MCDIVRAEVDVTVLARGPHTCLVFIGPVTVASVVISRLGYISIGILNAEMQTGFGCISIPVLAGLDNYPGY